LHFQAQFNFVGNTLKTQLELYQKSNLNLWFFCHPDIYQALSEFPSKDFGLTEFKGLENARGLSKGEPQHYFVFEKQI